MRAAIYHDREDIRVEDVESDPVGPGDVRIDVDSCGICGSDLHEYAAGSPPESRRIPSRVRRRRSGWDTSSAA